MPQSVFNSIEIAGLVSAIPKSIKKHSNKYTFRESVGLQTASDLGYEAAKKILDTQEIDLNEIGVLIFVSKTPDYRGPATAAVLQGRLGISIDCIAYDVNIGSSGFVYGSQIVCSNLDSINKKYGLLIVGDTTSKQVLNNENFSDGVSAILFEKVEISDTIIIDTRTYSEYYKSYMITKGGFRNFELDKDGMVVYDRTIKNNFLEINEDSFLEFANNKIPTLVDDFLNKNQKDIENLDVFALHQYNNKSIAFEAKLLKDKAVSIFEKYANSLGNTIPLIISNSKSKSKNDKIKLLACAFGEGFSVGLMSFSIKADVIYNIIESDNYFEEGYIMHN